MRQVECAGGIVVGPDKRIAVITNQYGKHTFPKGTRKDHETEEGTARREITEETGITNIQVVRNLGTLIRHGYTAKNGETPSVIKHIVMLHCVTDQTKLAPLAEDAKEAFWVPAGELADVLTWPEEVQFFEKNRVLLGV